MRILSKSVGWVLGWRVWGIWMINVWGAYGGVWLFLVLPQVML